jgi:flagellar biosynthesis/type III secretory pathway protein FliH
MVLSMRRTLDPNNAAASDDELEQAAREDEMINQAKEVLEDLSEDPEVRELASWREDHIKLDRMQRQMEMEEARTEGKAEGEAEGKAKGKAEGKRDMLLLLFERDGVTLNDKQQSQLESCNDPEQLDRWIRQALDGASPDDILG